MQMRWVTSIGKCHFQSLLYSSSHADLTDRIPPDRGLSNKKSSGVKGTKVWLMYLLASNADGLEKLPPLIIGKAKKPCTFQNKTGTQLSFQYQNNTKVWMTADIYHGWLCQWDHELGTRNHKIVLLQDNFSGHIIPIGLQNIYIINFKPNLTAHVQPMDQGIIWCFKAHYCLEYVECAISRYNIDITPSKIYDIDQLQAMCLANIVWHEVDTTTIRNCWHKAGILPNIDSPDSVPAPPTIPILSLLHTPSPDQDPIAKAEDRLRRALDDLEQTGVLQSKNRMDIETLLNPPEESWTMDVTTDEEICQAVLAAHKAQEEGGDDDAEEDAPVEPCPTYCELFQAVSTVNRFVECAAGDPVARRFERELASFAHHVRSERSRAATATHITDYFHT